MVRDKENRTYAGAPDSLRRGASIPLNVRIARLVELMRACIRNGKPVNFTEPSHREITEALHLLAYEQPAAETSERMTQLNVIYGDGRKIRPLQLRCLSALPNPPGTRAGALHVGTLTFRHLDYDDHVDVYLVRDRETRMKTAGEIDKLAYERMKEILDDPLMEREGSQIIIYQAGLEPLAVGMYRAIIEHLCERRLRQLPVLSIQPMFFVDERDERARGSLWT